MYKIQPIPDPTATLTNGSKVKPLATVKDEHGGVSHIIMDDNCIVLINKNPDDGLFNMVSHWYPEAVAALLTLALNPANVIMAYMRGHDQQEHG